MANKYFAQPVRMESQFVDTKLHTVMFDNGSAAPVVDGTLVVLGDFVKDPVYTAAYTAAGDASAAPIDINTRKASAPSADTATGVCLIDLSNVPTAVGAGNTYRIGSKTIGLTAEAGVPVRARMLVANDTFMIGEDNCQSPLTVGQYAKCHSANGQFAPDVSDTATGLVAKVIDKRTISQGVNANVVAYTLCVVHN